MRYIKSYLRTLSSDTKIETSDKSSSAYATIDGGFTVRLSDHLSPTDWGGLQLNVVKLWNSPDFLVMYRNTRTPMLMTRKEVKEYARFCLQNWRLEVKAREAVIKWRTGGEDGKADTSAEEKYINKFNVKYPSLPYLNTWKRLGCIIGQIPAFKLLAKDSRKYIGSQFDDGHLDYRDILTVLHRYKGKEMLPAHIGNTISMYISSKDTSKEEGE